MLVEQAYLLIKQDLELSDKEDKIFVHKFVLLILAFVSQDEQFMWQQEERVENFRKTGIDRK